jgi:signal transduction histidine kinase
MPIGYIFWAIFLVIIILSVIGWRTPNWQYGWANNIVILILLFLLGWAEFGFILQGGAAHRPF